ncbi:DUF6241 domain-containing protein [Oceanobacillus longus]|uniref:DUF6241 domain-containing protein n=1 Tax=Oceanobacillus longus TaxID=930120 RepID=A0ABV8GRC4_9BACI
MDGHLKKKSKDLENQIPVSFTEKDKQAILKKIKTTEQSRKTNAHQIFPKLMTAFVLVGAIFLLISITISDFNQEQTSQIEENDQIKDVDEEMEEKKSVREKNPFGNFISHGSLKETDYLQYIHWMSHQKVIAENKWGFYEITDERISWLIEGLEKRDFGHEETYRDILERWASGDFSEVDEDHNIVHGILGGTEDEATGILSPEEEQEYINNTQEVSEIYNN